MLGSLLAPLALLQRILFHTLLLVDSVHLDCFCIGRRRRGLPLIGRRGALYLLKFDLARLVESSQLQPVAVGFGWQAGPGQAGVYLMESLSDAGIEEVASQVAAVKQAGDLVVASIHWGGNWGYRISPEQQRFAYGLIDRAGVDVVHGHSSHHPKGIEIYHDRAILYGCGDFLNDYEGISGFSQYRGDLTLMYFLTLSPHSGKLLHLQMTPLQIRQFRLQRSSEQDRQWLEKTMDRECRRLGARVRGNAEGRFELCWQ